MSHRALTGLLIASMAVNLLLAGLIIGHMVRSDGRTQLPLAWAFKEVSPEIREKVRPIIRPQVGRFSQRGGLTKPRARAAAGF